MGRNGDDLIILNESWACLCPSIGFYEVFPLEKHSLLMCLYTLDICQWW